MSNVVVVGMLLLIIIAAITFYLYSRIVYSERKISLMENILLDIKMAMEMEREVHPSNNADDGHAHANDLVEPKFENVTKDDTEYYNNVLENAAIEAEELKPTPAAEAAPTSDVPVASGSANFDELTRDELVAIAEKKGLRVTKRATKQQIISLVRDADKNTSGLPETGTDGPVGGNAGSVEGASLLSGELESSTPE
jgi:type II secretory pathway pseudopilin PulG